MLNCDERECRNYVDHYDNPAKCKVLNIEEPMDIWDGKNLDCQHFEQNKTCRECKHSILAFYCHDDWLDYEEDYKCKFDKKVYSTHTSMSQDETDYQCECGKFEYIGEDVE